MKKKQTKVNNTDKERVSQVTTPTNTKGIRNPSDKGVKKNPKTKQNRLT